MDAFLCEYHLMPLVRHVRRPLLRCRMCRCILTPHTVRRHVPMHMRPENGRFCLGLFQDSLNQALRGVHVALPPAHDKLVRVEDRVCVDLQNIVCALQQREGGERRTQRSRALCPDRVLYAEGDFRGRVMVHRFGVIKKVDFPERHPLNLCEFMRIREGLVRPDVLCQDRRAEDGIGKGAFNLFLEILDFLQHVLCGKRVRERGQVFMTHEAALEAPPPIEAPAIQIDLVGVRVL